MENTHLIFFLLFIFCRSQGAEFSKGDIIFIAVVIGACVLAIAVTVMCHLACRRKHRKEVSQINLYIKYIERNCVTLFWMMIIRLVINETTIYRNRHVCFQR